jgi:hypothetical protein
MISDTAVMEVTSRSLYFLVAQKINIVLQSVHVDWAQHPWIHLTVMAKPNDSTQLELNRSMIGS